MTMTKPLIFLALASMIIMSGCRDDSFDKYARPDWLAGKVYTQIKAKPELSTFAKCIEITGYDKILDVSGSYTVFAPSNEAFNLFFQQSSYKKAEDIPVAELTNIVKYHIVQNPWSKSQLRSLDVYGWIDTLDIDNNKPRGFKRETLFQGKDQKFGVKYTDKNYSIVDTMASNWRRKVAPDSRKFAPIFYKEYFNIYDLNTSDYEFYFQRPFDGGNDLYYAGAKISGEEVFAENGFVYMIDRVVSPMKNGYEILQSNTGENSYSSFLDLINLFPDFVYNENKTFDQPGAEQGLQVDSLFDLSYPSLTFNINREKTKSPPSATGLPGNVTIRYHHGLMAPTNTAFQAFLNQYIAGSKNWGTLRDAPLSIKRIIANTYMSINSIYLTDIEKGFLNGEADMVRLEKTAIIQKQFGSNCTFIGLNKAIIPRAFKSVTGPVYQQRGYSIAMNAIENAGLLPALKREGQHYMLFVESDLSLADDSSLFCSSTGDQFWAFQVSGSNFTRFSFSKNDIRNLLLNHIGTEIPKGVASKEFIKTLSGNYLIVDNVTGEVSGTAPTFIGYNGAMLAINKVPKQISVTADNGKTFEINNWFNFTSTDLYSKISSTYPKFQKLLLSAGLANDKESRYSFVSESEVYTIFAPSDAAIDKVNTAAMTKEQLQKFLMMHFIPGVIMFTDGNRAAGYYETARVDEKSTPYSTLYSQVYIEPKPDNIQFRAKGGGNYLTVPVSPLVNIITSRTIGTGSEPIRNILATAVIHEIDKPLLFDQLDTK